MHDNHVRRGSKGYAVHDAILARTNEFNMFCIKDCDGRGYYHSALEKEAALPCTYRPAFTFLKLLGRVLGHVEGSCPSAYLPIVKLANPIAARSEEVIEISHRTIQEVHDTVNKDMCLDSFYKSLGVCCPSAEQVYGSKAFCITTKEVSELLQSTLVTTAPTLPRAFYNALVGMYTSNCKFVVFFNIFRATKLLDLLDNWEGCLSSRKSVLEQEKNTHDERVKCAMQALQAGCCTDEERRCKQGMKYRNEVVVRMRTAALDLLNDQEKVDGLRACFTGWANKVLEMPARYGFTSRDAALNILAKSLVELSTEVCISQKGYFFTSGARHQHNLIDEKPAHPITFLSSPGLDFCFSSCTSVEGAKYFTKVDSPSNPCAAWGAFASGKHDELYERVKVLYTVIFESAEAQGVKQMSMLPLGLGVFLMSLGEELKRSVVEIYFKVQFDLLASKDWGFENYYLNAQQYTEVAQNILREMPTSCPCNIVLHKKDAKFLAVELSREGKAAFLNPSDSQAVMQGMMGLYWEKGRSWNYVGEEDWAATSTGVLACFGISSQNIGLASN